MKSKVHVFIKAFPHELSHIEMIFLQGRCGQHSLCNFMVVRVVSNVIILFIFRCRSFLFCPNTCISAGRNLSGMYLAISALLCTIPREEKCITKLHFVIRPHDVQQGDITLLSCVLSPPWSSHCVECNQRVA
jgi:hypothetical protein